MSGDSLDVIKGKNKSSKVVSIFLTFVVLGILLFSGPAQAIVLGVTDISTTIPNEGGEVSFLANLDLHTNDRIPLTNVTVNIKNSTGVIAETCTFNLEGTNLTSCVNFSISKLSGNYNYSSTLSGYGYGYGYNSSSGSYSYINQSFGYGYGYLAGYGSNDFNTSITSGEFIYNITWTTPSVSSDSIYSIQLTASANDGSDSAIYRTKTDSSDITVQNVAAATTPGRGNSGTTSVSEINLEEGYTKELRKNYKLKFNVNSETHSLTLKSFTSTNATIEIASSPKIVTLQIGETQKFDVTEDEFYDLIVTLNSINNNRAEITIKAIREAIPTDKVDSDNAIDSNKVDSSKPNEGQDSSQETTDSTLNNTDSNGGLWLRIIIAIIVIIAIIAGIFFFYKKRE